MLYFVELNLCLNVKAAKKWGPQFSRGLKSKMFVCPFVCLFGNPFVCLKTVLCSLIRLFVLCSFGCLFVSPFVNFSNRLFICPYVLTAQRCTIFCANQSKAKCGDQSLWLCPFKCPPLLFGQTAKLFLRKRRKYFRRK